MDLKLTASHVEVLTVLAIYPQGLHFEEIKKLTEVSSGICNRRLNDLAEWALVTYFKKTKRYRITKGGVDYLFTKDVGNWIYLQEPTPVRRGYATIVTNVGEAKGEFSDLLENPTFTSRLSQVASMMMEAWFRHTLDYLGMDEGTLGKVLDYGDRLTEYMHLMWGLSVPPKRSLVSGGLASSSLSAGEPFSFADQYPKLQEVEEMQFPTIVWTPAKLRRMKRLRYYLRHDEVKTRYEKFVDHLRNSTALLLPLTGFGGYSELDSDLKEVEGGIRDSKRSPCVSRTLAERLSNVR